MKLNWENNSVIRATPMHHANLTTPLLQLLAGVLQRIAGGGESCVG